MPNLVSARVWFPPLTQAPRELRVFHRKRRRGNAKLVLGFLLKNPAKREIGKFDPKTGLVSLHQPLLPRGRSKKAQPQSVLPFEDVRAAVNSLLTVLLDGQLFFRPWCELGEPDKEGKFPCWVGLIVKPSRGAS